MSGMSTEPDPRLQQLLTAARLARRVVASARQVVFDSSVERGEDGRPRAVTDPHAKRWIAEHDRALTRLNKALAAYGEKK